MFKPSAVKHCAKETGKHCVPGYSPAPTGGGFSTGGLEPAFGTPLPSPLSLFEAMARNSVTTDSFSHALNDFLGMVPLLLGGLQEACAVGGSHPPWGLVPTASLLCAQPWAPFPDAKCWVWVLMLRKSLVLQDTNVSSEGRCSCTTGKFWEVLDVPEGH